VLPCSFKHQSRKIYHGHRDRQRDAILAAAADLFVARGIEAVSVADIAGVARVTRPTIYQYFPNKQEIAWAVFEAYVIEEQAALPPEVWSADLTGAARLALLLEVRGHLLHANPARTLFFAQFDVLYAHERSTERMNASKRMLLGETEPLTAAVQAGIADGSLRSELDPTLTVVALHTLVAGLERRLATAQPTFAAEFDSSSEETYRMACHFMLQDVLAADGAGRLPREAAPLAAGAPGAIRGWTS
jgi:AcrR family transcriptional regulator